LRTSHGRRSGSGEPLTGAAGATTDGGDPDDLAEQIPKLYSSRTYKDYLRSQRISRLPHYLQRVQSPKASLSSRRGAIPMIDGDGIQAEGAASP